MTLYMIKWRSGPMYFCGFIPGLTSIPLFDPRVDEALKYKDVIEAHQQCGILRDKYDQDVEVVP